MNQIDILAKLAMEVDIADTIDFADLAIDEETAFKLMASHVIERNDEQIVDKAVIVKLLVENFVLNLRLLKLAAER